eukprot:g1031.t1
MSRRMTRSRSRSLLRESNEKSQTSKQPKGSNKLTSIRESSSSSSKMPKNNFQYYVHSMRDFIQTIDNLKDTTADIVALNFERLSQICDKMKQDIKGSNKHLTNDAIDIEVLTITEFAFLEFAGDKIDFNKSNALDFNGTDIDSRKKKKRKVTKHNIVEEKENNISSWLPGIFSLALKCAISSTVAGRVPFVLLDSVLNTQTIDVCEKIWDLVESLSEQISHETLVPADGRNISSKLWLLRLANTLLKRLSTTQNSLFCGRISLFLARIFPLSEKSALNLGKKRNTTNTTVFDSEEVFNNEVDNSSNDSTTKISYAAYTNFWKLQHDFFRDPTNVLKGPTPRRQFLQAVDGMLELFADNPLPQEKDGAIKIWCSKLRRNAKEHYKKDRKQFYRFMSKNIKARNVILDDYKFIYECDNCGDHFNNMLKKLQKLSPESKNGLIYNKLLGHKQVKLLEHIKWGDKPRLIGWQKHVEIPTSPFPNLFPNLDNFKRLLEKISQIAGNSIQQELEVEQWKSRSKIFWDKKVKIKVPENELKSHYENKNASVLATCPLKERIIAMDKPFHRKERPSQGFRKRNYMGL